MCRTQHLLLEIVQRLEIPGGYVSLVFWPAHTMCVYSCNPHGFVSFVNAHLQRVSRVRIDCPVLHACHFRKSIIFVDRWILTNFTPIDAQKLVHILDQNIEKWTTMIDDFRVKTFRQAVIIHRLQTSLVLFNFSGRSREGKCLKCALFIAVLHIFHQLLPLIHVQQVFFVRFS